MTYVVFKNNLVLLVQLNQMALLALSFEKKSLSICQCIYDFYSYSIFSFIKQLTQSSKLYGKATLTPFLFSLTSTCAVSYTSPRFNSQLLTFGKNTVVSYRMAPQKNKDVCRQKSPVFLSPAKHIFCSVSFIQSFHAAGAISIFPVCESAVFLLHYLLFFCENFSIRCTIAHIQHLHLTWHKLQT